MEMSFHSSTSSIAWKQKSINICELTRKIMSENIRRSRLSLIRYEVVESIDLRLLALSLSLSFPVFAYDRLCIPFDFIWYSHLNTRCLIDVTNCECGYANNAAQTSSAKYVWAVREFIQLGKQSAGRHILLLSSGMSEQREGLVPLTPCVTMRNENHFMNNFFSSNQSRQFFSSRSLPHSCSFCSSVPPCCCSSSSAAAAAIIAFVVVEVVMGEPLTANSNATTIFVDFSSSLSLSSRKRKAKEKKPRTHTHTFS